MTNKLKRAHEQQRTHVKETVRQEGTNMWCRTVTIRMCSYRLLILLLGFWNPCKGCGKLSCEPYSLHQTCNVENDRFYAIWGWFRHKQLERRTVFPN